MRTKKSINNIIYNLLFFSLNSIIAFLSKTVMITYIGSDYSGLNSICKSIVGMLNIAELGLSNAVTYSLYKPLKEKDYTKINSIMNTYKGIYKIIGSIILLFSVILLFFTDKFIHTNFISTINIKIYFSIFAIITVLSYFITYPQVLAMADQKSYIVTKTGGIINIVKSIIQIVVLILFKSYMIWILLEFIFTLYTYLYTNKKVKQVYEWLNTNNNLNLRKSVEENKNIVDNTKDIFVHKLAYMMGYQTDNIIISSFTNLNMITIYTSYVMVINMLRSIVMMIINGLRASVGDLISEGNDVKSYNTWTRLGIALNYIATVLSYCVYVNIQNLITIWIGNKFLMDKNIVLIMCIILFIQISMFDLIETFKNGYGIFSDRWAPILEGVINIVLSLILVKYFGVIGVLIGTLVSMLAVALWWKPYVVFKYGFKVSILEWAKRVGVNLIIALLSMGVSTIILNKVIISHETTITVFILNSIISLFIICTSYFLISLIDVEHRKIYKKLYYISYK